MPDFASEPNAPIAGCVDWVGLAGGEVPVTLPVEVGRIATARVATSVDLRRPDARGIHISRRRSRAR